MYCHILRPLCWASLGLVVGLYPGPVVLGLFALPLTAVGETLLLAKRLERPIAWFLASLGGGTIGALAGVVLGLPLMLMSGLNLCYTIQFFCLSLVQYLTLNSVERLWIGRWVLVNAGAAASATLIATFVWSFVDPNLYAAVLRSGYTERIAGIVVGAVWGIPLCMIIFTSLGVYLERQVRRQRVARAQLCSPALTV